MASVRRAAGAPSSRIAGNLRRMRKRRGLSTYDLAARLKEIGWPVQQSGITRVERGERRVDVDDLVALSVALNCSPNRLLMPEELEISRSGQVGYGAILIGDVLVDTRDMWAWACGEKPLVIRDREHWDEAQQPGDVDEALYRVENQPHHYVGGYAGLPANTYGAWASFIAGALAQGMTPAQLREFFERAITAVIRESADGTGP